MEVRAATLGAPPVFLRLPPLPPGWPEQTIPQPAYSEGTRTPEIARWRVDRSGEEEGGLRGCWGGVSGAAPHGLGLRELLGATPGGGKEAERLRHREREREAKRSRKIRKTI